jgi:hypothetical protein
VVLLALKAGPVSKRLPLPVLNQKLVYKPHLFLQTRHGYLLSAGQIAAAEFLQELRRRLCLFLCLKQDLAGVERLFQTAFASGVVHVYHRAHADVRLFKVALLNPAQALESRRFGN